MAEVLGEQGSGTLGDMPRRRSSHVGLQVALLFVCAASAALLLLANVTVLLGLVGASSAAGSQGVVFFAERIPRWLATLTWVGLGTVSASAVGLGYLRLRDPSRTRWWEDPARP